MKARRPGACAWMVPVVWAALSVLLCGCGVAPARVDRRASRVANTIALPLHGEYDVTFRTAWVGPITGRMVAEPTPEGFKANTPPGVAWGRVGGMHGVLGPVVAPFLFPYGMIVTWQSTLPHDGQPGEGTIGVGTLKSLRLRTLIPWPSGPPEIVLRDGRVVAVFSLVHADGTPAPVGADYAALAERGERVLRENLYDAAIAESQSVRAYLSELRESAPKARDDIEFLFGAGAAAYRNLKFNMPLFYRTPPPPGESQLQDTLGEMITAYRVAPLPAGFVSLRFDAIVDPASVERAAEEVLAGHPRGVVLDLRNAGGVESAVFLLASRLTDREIDFGVFVTRAGRADALKDLAGVPTVRVRDAASLTELERTLDSDGAARVIVEPAAAERRFSGPLAVLISKRTTSLAEPLAWGLRNSGRAKVYGQPSAGRPYMTREFDVGQGWVIRLAAADYRTASGDVLTRRGVTPDVRSDRGDPAITAWTDMLVELAKAGALPDAPTPDRSQEPRAEPGAPPSKPAVTSAP